MLIRRPKPLPAGDFFYFHDARSERDLLKQARPNKDPDPAFTSWAREQRAIYYDSLPPELKHQTHGGTLYRNHLVPMPKELVHRQTAMRVAKPKRPLPHTDRILDLAEFANVYIVVSQQWKDAIESVEPGVHEFFHHELLFKDGIEPDRFIMRNRNHADFLSPTTVFLDIDGKWKTKGARPKKVTPLINRTIVSDFHWFRQQKTHFEFVSRPLAEQLRPLLPKKITLLPIPAT